MEKTRKIIPEADTAPAVSTRAELMLLRTRLISQKGRTAGIINEKAESLRFYEDELERITQQLQEVEDTLTNQSEEAGASE